MQVLLLDEVTELDRVQVKVYLVNILLSKVDLLGRRFPFEILIHEELFGLVTKELYIR